MRGILGVCFSFFLLPITLFAARWTPYIGGAVQYDVAFAHYHLASLTRSGALHDFGCWGSQFEVGVSSDNLSIYGGYHLSTSSLYVRESAMYMDRTGTGLQQIGSQVEENRWREKRGLVGVRWLIHGESGNVVTPVVGFALTYGKSRLGWEQTQRAYPSKQLLWSQDVSRTSSYSLGTMLEFGLLVQPRLPIAFTLLAQFHRFEADFGATVPYVPANRYVVLLPSGQLGLRYNLPSFRLGK